MQRMRASYQCPVRLMLLYFAIRSSIAIHGSVRVYCGYFIECTQSWHIVADGMAIELKQRYALRSGVRVRHAKSRLPWHIG